MKKSAEILEQFLETEYIHNPEMGSPDMRSAIRDLLTDLMHIADHHDISITNRLQGARAVYKQELD